LHLINTIVWYDNRIGANRTAFTLRDAQTGQPVPEATLAWGALSATTDAAGRAVLYPPAAPATHRLTARAPGYVPRRLELAPDGARVETISLVPRATLRYTVRDPRTEAPVVGATVSAGEATATTDEAGEAVLPLDAGAYTVTVQATGYAPWSESVGLYLGQRRAGTVALLTDGPLSLQSQALPFAVQGQAYGGTLVAVGGVYPYTVSPVGGELPPGLSLDSTPYAGLGAWQPLTGEPTETGRFPLALRVTDGAGRVAEWSYTLEVLPPLTLAAPPLPEGTRGVAYDHRLTVAGADTAVAFEQADGTLPPGLTLTEAGRLQGTPTAAGAWTVTVAVRDERGRRTARAYELIIGEPPAVGTERLPDGEPGLAYTASLTATEGRPPYTWTVATGRLPEGLTLEANRILRGTPTTATRREVTLRVTDADGRQGERAFTLAVQPLLAAADATLPPARADSPYEEQVPLSGGVAPLSVEPLVQPVEGLELGIQPTALGLTGTPTMPAGRYDLRIRITDSRYPTPETVILELGLPVQTGLTVLTPRRLPDGHEAAPYRQELVAAGGSAPYTWTLTGDAGSSPIRCW